MSTLLLIALTLPLVSAFLLVWPCLLLAGRSDAQMPSPPDLD